jgi:nucleoside-diphosphate-sugar epimerase
VKALIGYTGFVGSNLSKQVHFDYLFNSSNIHELKNNRYDLIVCAAPSAVKWKANKEPEADLALIHHLMEDLSNVKTRHFVHISTIDVYDNPVGVDEDTTIDTGNLHPYGKHRLLLEKFVRDTFDDHLIIRLPALFGEGLKKNLVYDLLNNNCLELQDADSEFQFYNSNRLFADISTAQSHSINILNISTPPMCSREIAQRCFGIYY